jgi:hypothetical protein
MEELLTPSRTKVFGIGLSRTGTTSLHAAFCILGYRSIHYPPLHKLRELLNEFDAATDTSVACVFSELDNLYPESRFVLTVRDQDSWLESTKKFFSKPTPEDSWRQEVRMRVYGALVWERETFATAYSRHLETVMNYFEGRPNSLLRMNIVAGDGWSTLCPFLGVATPSAPFPYLNKN